MRILCNTLLAASLVALPLSGAQARTPAGGDAGAHMDAAGRLAAFRERLAAARERFQAAMEHLRALRDRFRALHDGASGDPGAGDAGGNTDHAGGRPSIGRRIRDIIRRHFRPLGHIFPCLVQKYDADGDGKLSRDELKAAVEARRAEILAQFDADGDGELSAEERQAAHDARKAEREARRAEILAALLEEFDADGDGELSAEERQAARDARKAEILAEFDADGDGELNAEERAAARAARCAGGDMTQEEEAQDAAVEAIVLGRDFVRSDVNEDGSTDISDGVFVLNYLFGGGRTPVCMDAADSNDDGQIDIADPIATLSALFLGGTPIPPPADLPGLDPTPDGLDCDGAADLTGL